MDRSSKSFALAALRNVDLDILNRLPCSLDPMWLLFFSTLAKINDDGVKEAVSTYFEYI